ncbi:hypothetical protein Tco_0543022 [Tanacetum coccineum]
MRPPRHSRNANVKTTLRTGKWEAVIIIDDGDDKNEVAETENNVEVKEEHVIVNVPNQHDIVDDDVPLATIKRNEAENNNPWEVDDEVADEDEVDDENEVDDEDEWI